MGERRAGGLTARIVTSLSFTPIVAVVVVTVCMAAVFLAPENRRAIVLVEGGPIEMATAIALLAGSFFCLLLARRDTRFCIACALCFGLFAAREFDLHNAVTTEGVFRTSFYVNPEISIVEKAVVLLVLGVVASALLYLVIRRKRAFIDGLRRGSAAQWSIAAGLSFFVIAKGCDTRLSFLEPLGFSLPRDDIRLQALEESLELAGAIALVCAVVQFAVSRSLRTTKTPPTAHESE